MAKTQHLGHIDEPLLIFGGPYSNLQATEAILAEARMLNIPFRRVICTGDVAAYCGDPQACSDIIRAAGIHVVKGNCEESFGVNAEDCGCGFDEGSTCDQLSARWYAYAQDSLDTAACRWMADLPDAVTFRMAERTVFVTHATATSNNRFVFASTADTVKAAELDAAGADAIICGHSGLPFTQPLGDRLWHNAGVVGMPANDGTPRTWFSVVTPAPGGIHFAHRPLEYDHAGAARRMRDHNLPEEYASCLGTGLWDNCDILPEAETAAQGQEITPGSHLWPAAEAVRHAGVAAE